MKKINTLAIFLGCCFLLFTQCKQENTVPQSQYIKEVSNPEFLHRSVKRLTDVIVHNTFSPPVASRIYVYSSIAAYEVSRLGEANHYESLAGQLTDFKAIPALTDTSICLPIASVHAYLSTGKKLIFTEDSINAFKDRMDAEYAKIGVPKAIIEKSKAYGESVAAHIIEWSKKDMYAETRTFPKYAINDEEAMWQPTPPDFMDGIEPHWAKIRPFVIKSASQFVPAKPTAFSKDKNSQFYKEALVVYEKGKKIADFEKEALSEEQQSNIAIAEFWDCNPYVSHHGGHAMYATKKITPGGHWVNITALVARKAKSDFMETTAAYALTCIALADGFISCWDEKYRSNLIRPETYINKYIDETWQPLLQTPPFPEYTSGHSVVSSAASVALTSIYGDDFAFDDTSEQEYGLPMRSFTSFYAASAEAALSRLYGGIHYIPAIDNGVTQGKAIGEYIVKNVVLGKLKK